MKQPENKIVLELFIVFFFLLALFFALPIPASDDVELCSPTMGTIALSVITFAIAQATMIYRDRNLRRNYILYVSALLHVFGYWVFLAIAQDVLIMNMPPSCRLM